ncbi:MAG: lipopolysaccharide kinase InaA family protein [Candidatus Bathyarchaeia archaeon]
MNYFKVLNGKNVFVFGVDEWVFERDVDRGFLGEALAGRLIFPYTSLINETYLYAQEVKLKKRLIRESLENIVLDFPELSYEICIKPEYFMYEAMLNRVRLFPPMIYSLSNFMDDFCKMGNGKKAYLEALRALEMENVISFCDGFVKISKEFVDGNKSRRVRFINLFKPAQKALFTSLLDAFPKVLASLLQNGETFLRLQKNGEEKPVGVYGVEDPQKYLYVPTASGLVPLANRMDIEAFARNVLCVSEDAEISIEDIGGVLNNAYLVKAFANGKEQKIVVKRFKDWSSFKWFPLTLWTFGTRTFTVLGRSRLEKECAINQLLYSKGFDVPKLLHVNHGERLVFMEYVEGESLEKILKRVMASRNGERVERELAIIKAVGKKFAEVHALGIALGDTKPENIIVGKNGKIYLLDFEQASRKGDKTWDIAEFLYYSGHYLSPFVSPRAAELITKAFIEGYLDAGGNVETVKAVGSPKYTKVFSVFTLPSIILAISKICRKVGEQRK